MILLETGNRMLGETVAAQINAPEVSTRPLVHPQPSLTSVLLLLLLLCCTASRCDLQRSSHPFG